MKTVGFCEASEITRPNDLELPVIKNIK